MLRVVEVSSSRATIEDDEKHRFTFAAVMSTYERGEIESANLVFPRKIAKKLKKATEEARSAALAAMRQHAAA